MEFLLSSELSVKDLVKTEVVIIHSVQLSILLCFAAMKTGKTESTCNTRTPFYV